MSHGPFPSAPDCPGRHDAVVLEPAERKAALLQVIDRARQRLVLSLFRCRDVDVLDALARALERGVRVEILLTHRAGGGRRQLKALWRALADMGASVHTYRGPAAKYHAKYVVADAAVAVVMSLNPTPKCFTRSWDVVVVTSDAEVVGTLSRLFDADVAAVPVPPGVHGSRVLVGPEHTRDRVQAFLDSARDSLRILDHKLSDRAVLQQLRRRYSEGVQVSVLGSSLPGPLVPHGRMVIADGERALVGSLALTARSLDARREVALIVDDAAAVRELTRSFDQLQTSAACLVRGWRGATP